MKTEWRLRLARESDVPVLEQDIGDDKAALSAPSVEAGVSPAKFDESQPARLPLQLKSWAFRFAASTALERYDVHLANGLRLPVVRMRKDLTTN